MSYKKRKTLTLPSGATVTVRPRTRLEDIRIGSVPSWMLKHKDGEELTEVQQKSLNEYLTAVERVILPACSVSPITNGEESFTVVDIDPKDTKPDQISWAEIEPEDRAAMVEAINELSGLSKAGQEARKTFPEKPEPASADPLAG